MSKRATGSNARDPENRSAKDCVCGGHGGRKGSKPNGKKRGGKR